MPVQDNEIPKAEEQVFENEAEKLKQAMQKSKENSKVKSQKLLPFLNVKAEFHQNRIDTLNEKIATREDKIARNEAKIEKLSAKADRLEDRNTMLKNTLGNLPVIKKLIESNEKKIENIRDNKIPRRKQKIERHKDKIVQFNNKRDGIEHKLNRVLALNDVIKSFSIGLNKERREVFTNAMDRLNSANTDCLNDKISALQKQKSQFIEEYNNPQTSAVDKYNLQEKLNIVNDKITNLEDKVHKLARPENHFAEQTNDVVDATMQIMYEKIAEVADNGEIGLTEIAENLFVSADKVEELEREEIAGLADKFNYLENTEVQLEDDYNSIDGIINNGSKAELETAQKDLANTLSVMKDIVSNRYMMQSIKEDTAKEIPKVEAQLSAINKALESLAEKSASSVDDKGKINPDFYKSLKKEERHIESMSERQAEKVISALLDAGISFSSVNRAKEKTAITVAKKDASVLKDMMKNAQKTMEEESRQAWRSLGDAFMEAYEETHTPVQMEVKKPEVNMINPDYFKSLTKDNRAIHVEAKEVADKVMSQLENKGIQFSASERQNGTTAITVSKYDDKAYTNISDFIKENRAVQFINADFFKSLPKEERATQRMSQEQAQQKIAELSEKNIPHSAVLNGEKSAVTVEKKNVGAAFFSRDKLKKSAQRINNKGKSQEQAEKPKNRSQGLEQ